jgi:hypothetical protein
MIPDPRNNRTTENPGRVDLPAPRRTPGEVAQERKQKEAAAKQAMKVKKAAAARVATLEHQGNKAAQTKTTGAAGTKVSRKRPADSEIEVISPSLYRDEHPLKPQTPRYG